MKTTFFLSAIAASIAIDQAIAINLTAGDDSKDLKDIEETLKYAENVIQSTTDLEDGVSTLISEFCLNDLMSFIFESLSRLVS